MNQLVNEVGESHAADCRAEEVGRSGPDISSSSHPTELLPSLLSQLERELWPPIIYLLTLDEG